MGGGPRDPGQNLTEIARRYVGQRNGRIANDAIRSRVVRHNMNTHAFRLTQRRTVEESRDARTPGPATSIFKMYGTELQQDRSSLLVEIRGVRGLGWEGRAFDKEEIEGTRNWLGERAASIYSGSNEIQRNIIAKRVLGLPD
jgi:alkylation response protein AidB-like acyl-CoA dehydrogenase